MNKTGISLTNFAKQNDITYVTAHRHWLKGNIDGIQLPTGKIVVYGWKKPTGTKQVVIFARFSPNKDKNSDLLNLKDIAKKSSLTVDREIIWDSYVFQMNPYLSELYETASVIICQSYTDLFGANYQFMVEMFNKNEIKIITLREPTNIPNSIYKVIKASSNIAKAAVGMSSHKKEIAEANNSILM